MSTPNILKFTSKTVIPLRRAHTPATTLSRTRIYNAPINKEVMKNWHPQTPEGPTHDGWALKRWPFKARNMNALFVKACIFVWTGFWAPFLIVQYQLKKANAGK